MRASALAVTLGVVLKVIEVSKSYPGATRRAVLTGISLELDAGEWAAILGESGSGKSTLLNLIAGLEAPDSGRIVVAGHDLAALDDDARTSLRRQSIGFVFQAFHVLPYLSVARNVALPLALNGWTTGEANGRVTEMLTAVGLAERADSRPRELSGGELQRVAIARALAHRPKLVLADEPTGNLDQESAALVIALLRDTVKANGAAGLLVTHSHAAAATADRVLTLTRAGLSPA